MGERPQSSPHYLPSHVANDDVVSAVVASPLSTVRNLTSTDVAFIWWKMCESIAEAMAETRGVHIQSFCTFLPGAGEGDIPSFILSERFLQLYSVQTRVQPPLSTAKLPIVPLNLSEISHKTQCDRGTIDNCIHEIIQAFGKLVTHPQGISLDFPSLGRLTAKYGKIKFRFFKEFLEQPGPTAEPWLRKQLVSRAGTAATFNPPMVPARGITPRLLRTPDYNLQGLGNEPYQFDVSSVFTLRPITADGLQATRRASGSSLPPLQEMDESSSPPRNKVLFQNHLTAGIVGILDPDYRDDVADVLRIPKKNLQPLPLENVDENELEMQARLAQRAMDTTLFRPLPPIGEVDTVAKAVAWDYARGPVPSLDLQPVVLPKHKRDNPLVLPKFHATDMQGTQLPVQDHKHPKGQTCYVCYQRSLLDQNPKVIQEAQEKDRAFEDAIHSATARNGRVIETIDKKLYDAKKQAEKRTAVFNLGTTLNKPSSPVDTVPQADIFAFRPPTSDAEIKRAKAEHAADLAAQANEAMTASYNKALHDYEDGVARQDYLRQVNREQQQRDREDKLRLQQKYHEDLATQRQFKQELELAQQKAEKEIVPGIARSHTPTERMRELGKEVARLQREQIEAKQAREEQRKLEKLEAEQAFLRKTRQEFRDEAMADAAQRFEANTTLQNEWVHAHTKKIMRDDQEHIYQRENPSKPLLDQLLPYDRCNVCYRDVHNSGESRIVAASYMTPSKFNP